MSIGYVSGSFRVSRGGSWYFVPRLARVAYREDYPPSYRRYHLGLRLFRRAP